MLYVGSQMLSTLLMPTSLDKTQRYLFLALPVVFAVVIVNQTFPAGLLIYWITTNLWTVGQALVIRQFFPPPMVKARQEAAAAAEARQQRGAPKAKPKPLPAAESAADGAGANGAPASPSGTGASAAKKRKGDRTRQRNVRRPAKPDRPRRQAGDA